MKTMLVVLVIVCAVLVGCQHTRYDEEGRIVSQIQLQLDETTLANLRMTYALLMDGYERLLEIRALRAAVATQEEIAELDVRIKERYATLETMRASIEELAGVLETLRQ